MNVLLPLLIAAIGIDVPIEVRYPEAAEVFHCTFDDSWDEDFDGQPDGWERRRGPGFPPYVGIKISEEPSPATSPGETGQCLRIDLNGGAAVAYSPAIEVGPLFSYVLEAYLKTEDLEHDRAYFSITLLDEKRYRLQTFYSRKIRNSDGWKKVRLGPISAQSDDVRFAVIGLHLQPDSRADLWGAAVFDDVWLGRLPRMALKANDPYQLFTVTEEVEITCTASGLLAKDPQIVFQLEDVLGNELARVQRPLDLTPADTGPATGVRPSLTREAAQEDSAREPEGQIGRTRWKPPIPGPGFYRIRATMKGRESLIHRRQLELAVIDPRRATAGGEFGWSLPGGDQPLPLPLLSRLVGQAGINWLKYPLWYEEEGSEEFVTRLMAFGERLGAQGIELIGMLHEPPPSLRARYGQAQSPASRLLPVVNLFAPDPKVWYPSLEPVMTRLATQVRWWQLGHDQDRSFIEHPRLVEKIAEIKSELDRIGQDVNLALAWNWINELPQPSADQLAEGSRLPWRAVALSADPSMTDGELATYLDASKDTALLRWVVLEPLPVDVYPTEARATDLVRRMIAAKIHGADAIFCPQPFSTQRGLFSDDGTPGELFLVWRTAALALGGAKFLGSVELPEGSSNQVFARAADAVMIVWNDRPTDEVIYLGDDVRQIDLWGRSVTPENKGHRQVIKVGRLPTFVIGLNEPITRWRMDVTLQRKRIPSVFGRPHQNSFAVKNHFPQGASGQIELVTPDAWRVDSKLVDFRLAGGEELRHPFEITLPHNASSGRHKIRVDFDVQSDRPYQFSVYRRMDIGLGDVYIEVATRLNGQGELEVHQQFINETDAEVNFRCQLFAPDRRRRQIRVFGIGRTRDLKVYRLPNGRELLGKTLWLRAEETDGPRVLNYRFVATP